MVRSEVRVRAKARVGARVRARARVRGSGRAWTDRGLRGVRMSEGWLSVVEYVERIVSASHSSTLGPSCAPQGRGEG